MSGIARVQSRLGRYLDALTTARLALAAAARVGDPDGEAAAQRVLGDVARDTGHYDEAARHFSKARDIALDLGNECWRAEALIGLADTLGRAGQQHDASVHYQTARRAARRPRDRYLESSALHGLARVEHELGWARRARRHCLAALEGFEALHLPEAELARILLADLDPSARSRR